MITIETMIPTKMTMKSFLYSVSRHTVIQRWRSSCQSGVFRVSIQVCRLTAYLAVVVESCTHYIVNTKMGENDEWRKYFIAVGLSNTSEKEEEKQNVNSWDNEKQNVDSWDNEKQNVDSWHNEKQNVDSWDNEKMQWVLRMPHSCEAVRDVQICRKYRNTF